jgi:hypothetical protein
MHHCVGSGTNYSLNPDCIIFSARIAEQRVETVEFSLEQMKVVQCHGLQNKDTEHHADINEIKQVPIVDFLSAVILGIGRGEDHIVLNSVANMQKVHHLLDGYAQVYCHLDNDEAGENACAELQKRYGDKVIDHSHLYTGYKDLNEYLMSHKTRK